jgi:hypothetical protein
MATIRDSTCRDQLIVAIGDVFIRRDTRMPGSLKFEFEECGAWKKLLHFDCYSVELLAFRVGWSFSYIAPQQVKGKAFGFGLQSAMNSAVNDVLRTASRTNFNALEITQVMKRRVVGTHYVHILAHPRQLRPNPFLRDTDSYYFPNRTQNPETDFPKSSIPIAAIDGTTTLRFPSDKHCHREQYREAWHFLTEPA